jgi:HK97 family phage major capsid protein
MHKDELLQKKAEAIRASDEILTKAKDEGRYDLSAEETKRFDEIHADLAKIQSFLDKLAKQEGYAETTGRRSEPVQPEQRAAGRSESRVSRVSQDDLNFALAGWALPASKRSEQMVQAANRVGYDLNAKELSFRLPKVAMRSLAKDDVQEWERRTAQGTTSGAVGQYLVPDEAMRALEVSLLAYGGMRSVATVIRTETGADLPIPTVNDTASTGEIITENNTANEAGVTFAQTVLQSFLFSSKYILVSQQLLQDSAFNVGELLGRLLGERIARITNTYFTTGDGSGKPRGVVSAAGDSTVTAASSTLFTYDEVLDLVHSVDPAYRNNARFMLGDTCLKNLKKIKVLQYSGDVTGAPLWQPSMQLGAPDTIMGFPYTINQAMAAPASGAKSLIFGDLSKYLIRDVRDIVIQRLDERFAEYHQVAFLAFSRHDGDLLDAGTDPVKWADHT